LSFATTYVAVGEIFVGRVNFKHPATNELVQVVSPTMSIVTHDDPRGLDAERTILPASPMMQVREGVYVLGVRVDSQFEQFKTYFVSYDAVIQDPEDPTGATPLFRLHEEERLRIADFRTAIPHYHVSPTEIILLSYYYSDYSGCGCWVFPQGPFFVNGDGGGGGPCGGEQFQYPDGNTNLGCCNDFGMNFSLE